MHHFIVTLLLSSTACAIPSSSFYGLDSILPRAVNDQCAAPQGSGTCLSKSTCPGISYVGLCPKDPQDIQVIQCYHPILLFHLCRTMTWTQAYNVRQCCVKINCEVPSAGQGFCRSVSRDACAGGSFYPDKCPGDADIKCCVKTAPAVPAQPPQTTACTSDAFDRIAFATSIADFLKLKSAKDPGCFIW